MDLKQKLTDAVTAVKTRMAEARAAQEQFNQDLEKAVEEHGLMAVDRATKEQTVGGRMSLRMEAASDAFSAPIIEAFGKVDDAFDALSRKMYGEPKPKAPKEEKPAAPKKLTAAQKEQVAWNEAAEAFVAEHGVEAFEDATRGPVSSLLKTAGEKVSGLFAKAATETVEEQKPEAKTEVTMPLTTTPEFTPEQQPAQAGAAKTTPPKP